MSRAARQAALSVAPLPARTLRAGPLAAGALARGAHGRLVALNRGAWLARLATGDLVALLPAGAPLHPWALTLPGAPAPPPADAALRVSDGVLALGPLRVPLAGLAVARLAAPRLAAPPDRARVAALAALASTGAGADAADVRVATALGGFAAGDAGALGALVGLGPGLTPSGDDVLAGVLAALDAAAAPALRSAVVGAVGGRLAERTTRLSAQLLSAAIDGCYAEPILHVIAAMDGAAPALERAAGALIAAGAHTGRATLAGLAAALARVV